MNSLDYGDVTPLNGTREISGDVRRFVRVCWIYNPVICILCDVMHNFFSDYMMNNEVFIILCMQCAVSLMILFKKNLHFLF